MHHLSTAIRVHRDNVFLNRRFLKFDTLKIYANRRSLSEKILSRFRSLNSKIQCVNEEEGTLDTSTESIRVRVNKFVCIIFTFAEANLDSDIAHS